MTIALKKIEKVMFSQATFWTMVGVIILLVLSYIYFVNAIVWNVATRQQTEKKLSNLTAEMATLEAQYVELTSSINIEHAYSMGFQDTPDSQTEFVKRSSTLGSLPMRQVQ